MEAPQPPRGVFPSIAKMANAKLVKKLLQRIEKNKKKVALLLLIAIVLTLMLTRIGNFLVFTLTAVVYPFNQTMRAVKKNYHGELSKWLVYWLCFALFYAIQHIVHLFFSWRDYNFLVFAFVLYMMYCPHMNLTEILFDSVQGSIIKKFFDTDIPIDKVAQALPPKEAKKEVTVMPVVPARVETEEKPPVIVAQVDSFPPLKSPVLVTPIVPVEPTPNLTQFPVREEVAAPSLTETS